jgi:cytochrome b
MNGRLPATDLQRVRVWDLPTRVFHWLLATLVVASIVSAKIGGNAMAWHFRSGYAIFALLLFRIVWGLVGGRWSRFWSFAHPPSAIWRHLRGAGRASERIGHNPLGALSVFGLLALLIAQVGSGLFADDEIADAGPLVRFVSEATSHRLTAWHKAWGEWLIIALAVLHVAAIAYYLSRKHENLVGPMWRGDKLLPPGTPGSADHAASRIAALLLAAACAGLVAWVVTLGG